VQTAPQHGFTHPNEGDFVMLPKEFDAILALVARHAMAHNKRITGNMHANSGE
jgi:hypothetical protein